MKTCSKCKEIKPIEEFAKKRNKRSSYCKECQKVLSRKHYQENKDRYRERNRRRQYETIDYIHQLKESTPCARCGQFYPYYVMDFHHRDRASKIATINSIVTNRSRVLAEIEKCDILCANCHRIVEHGS